MDVIAAGTGNVAPHVESGKLRSLAVTSAQRLTGPLAVAPTWPELGYKGVFENWRGVIGARGITPEQIDFWEDVFRRVMSSDQFRAYAEQNQ